MDLQQLKTFLEVCQTRHFGHAASNLYLTQSAVSFRIRQLESQLGAALFVRHRNNLQLTAAGERFRQHAESIITRWEQARLDVASQQDRAPTLSLASTTAIWQAWLGPALLDLHDELADRHWQTETLTPDQISRRLLERSLDLAILPVPLKVDELNSQLLTSLPLVLITPGGVTAEQALEHNFVHLDWAPNLPSSSQPEPLPTASLRTSDLSLAKQWITRNNGAAVLPESLLQHEQVSWQGWPELTRTELPLYLIHHASHPDLANLAPVIDYLLQR
ncbi:LysR family transcriptional regulator [Saccharospirillum mangrovi]|uniref:LysR family transcriptional regulator n=1 Tax=Saccharospirillum mangrovi TaxID=2161747 RepID=UPI000D354599|nr:LysR family transcriptional regulator [Saccharospirillum mangrovi]